MNAQKPTEGKMVGERELKWKIFEFRNSEKKEVVECNWCFGLIL